MKFLLPLLIIFFISCKHEVILPAGTIVNMPSNAISVKEYGAKGDGTTNDNTAFITAMNMAHANNKILFIPKGTYVADIKLLWDSLVILGENEPGYNLSKSFLMEGTIIHGSVNANNKKNVSISHLGIQSEQDALVTGDGTGTLELNQTYHHISLAGNGYLGYHHGFLSQSGGNITLTNISVYNFYHGIAFRCSNVLADSITAINCAFTSIVIKSSPGENELTENVVIKNVSISGDKKDLYKKGGAIMVQAFTDKCITRNVNISNVQSEHGGIAAVLIEQNDTGLIENVNVSNCFADDTGDNSTRAAFDITGGTNITFTNCNSLNAKAVGFRCGNNIHNVKVINSLESGSKVASWQGKFTYLQLNGKEIVK